MASRKRCKSKADGEGAELPKGRKGLGQWMKGFSFGTFKGKSGDGQKKSGDKGRRLAINKHKKSHTAANGAAGKNNNPYPESGHLQQHGQSPASSANGHLSFATSRPPRESFNSSQRRSLEEREEPGPSNKSGAPTLATNAETIHSDAGHSKAATATTHGGALSSIDGAGPDSTFSSPSQSQHSLTTTLTTIQSTSANNALQGPSAGNATAHHHGSLNNPNQNVTFSHQYPVSPAPSQGGTVSAIPRHLQDSMPNTYTSATTGNLLSDNASIMTLASSSKRRRRSMDTDASVRALAPSSVWGGSRESLPLSVLSGHTPADDSRSVHPTSHSRPSIGGLASAERASVYSSSGITAPALASERNSYYSKRNADLADAKSLRSVQGVDARSMAGDARSVNADARSLGGDVGSLRNYEASVRSGAVGHGRNDSLPGSTVGSPLGAASPRPVGTGALSRRSSGFAEMEGVGEDEKRDGESEHTRETKPVADAISEVQAEHAAGENR